jgi:hypothetical protein
VVNGQALSTRASLAAGKKAAKGSQGAVMMLVQKAEVKGVAKKCLVYWDSGSSITLITNRYAKEAGLKGQQVHLGLNGIGDKTQDFITKIYKVPLVDRDGKVHEVSAVGIDEISAQVKPVNIKPVLEVFKGKIKPGDLDNPGGRVDILVGICDVDLAPKEVHRAGRLILLQSKFGTGYLVGGRVGQGDSGPKLTGRALKARINTFTPMDFISAEAVGTDVPRRCATCRHCKECEFKLQCLTWEENKQLETVEKGLKLDVEAKKWTASYPFTTPPTVLEDNYGQAVACMRSMEK